MHFLKNLICACVSAPGQAQQSWPDTDGKNRELQEQAWTLWSQPENEAPTAADVAHRSQLCSMCQW